MQIAIIRLQIAWHLVFSQQDIFQNIVLIYSYLLKIPNKQQAIFLENITIIYIQTLQLKTPEHNLII
jgi:hypothetical protein